MRNTRPVFVVLWLCSCAQFVEEPDQRSAVFGPRGGQLAFGGLSLRAPACALQQETAITARVAAEPLTGARGPTYELLPRGLTFECPVTIEIEFDASTVRTAWPLRLLTRVRGAEVAVPGSAQVGAVVRGEVHHFSPFAVGEETPVFDWGTETTELRTYGLTATLSFPVQALLRQASNFVSLLLAPANNLSPPKVSVAFAGFEPGDTWYASFVCGGLPGQWVEADPLGVMIIEAQLPCAVYLARAESTITIASLADCTNIPGGFVSGSACLVAATTTRITDAIRITADGFTLDCLDNALLLPPNHGLPAGILIEAEGVTVRNCVVDTSGDIADGITVQANTAAVEENHIVARGAAILALQGGSGPTLLRVADNNIGLFTDILVPDVPARLALAEGVFVFFTAASPTFPIAEIRRNTIAHLERREGDHPAAFSAFAAITSLCGPNSVRDTDLCIAAITANRVADILGEGIRVGKGTIATLSQNTVQFTALPALVLEQPRISISHNNFIAYGGPEALSPFAVTSDGAVELSQNGEGNFWDKTSPPLFSPGITSNSASVVDSFPYCRQDAWIDGDRPCECGGVPVPGCTSTRLAVIPSFGTWETEFGFDASVLAQQAPAAVDPSTLRFAFDFEGDGVLDVLDSSMAVQTHRFRERAAEYTPRVVVTSTSDATLSLTALAHVSVSNPVPRIQAASPAVVSALEPAVVEVTGAGFSEDIEFFSSGLVLDDDAVQIVRLSATAVDIHIPEEAFTGRFGGQGFLSNPPPGGGGAPVFTVLLQRPILTSLDPPIYTFQAEYAIEPDGTDNRLRILGDRMLPGVVVRVETAAGGPRDFPTQGVSGTEARVEIRRSEGLLTVGTEAVLTMRNLTAFGDESLPSDPLAWPTEYPQPEFELVFAILRAGEAAVASQAYPMPRDPFASQEMLLFIHGSGLSQPGVLQLIGEDGAQVDRPWSAGAHDDFFDATFFVYPAPGEPYLFLSGQTFTLRFLYPDGKMEEMLLPPSFPPGAITRVEPDGVVAAETAPATVKLHGLLLYPSSIAGAHAQFLPAAGFDIPPSAVVPVPVVSGDALGRFVEVELPQSFLIGQGNVEFTLQQKFGRAPYEIRYLTARMRVVVVPGETVPRQHAIVSRDRLWQRPGFMPGETKPPDGRRVGSSVTIRRSKAAENTVDVVITTWTRLKMSCLTKLRAAGVPFSSAGSDILTDTHDTAKLPWVDPTGILSGGGEDRFRRHRALFTRLPRGKWFHYQVSCANRAVLDGANDSYFRTPPSSSDDAHVQILFFGDHIQESQSLDYGGLQRSLTGQVYAPGYSWTGNPEAIWQLGGLKQSWIVRMVENARNRGLADFVMIGGDIADDIDDGQYAGYLWRFHSMWEPIVAGTPVFTVGGNHDAFARGLSRKRHEYFDMFDGPRDAPFESPFGRQFYSFDWGSAHVVGLDWLDDEHQPIEDLLRLGRNAGFGLFFHEVTNQPCESSSQCQTGLRCIPEVGSCSLTSAQREFFQFRDVTASHGRTRWRLVQAHGGPFGYDAFGERCGEIYDDFCAVVNDLGVDLMLSAHGDYGLQRHMASTNLLGQDFFYSFKMQRGGHAFTTTASANKEGVLHLRLRDDAIVLSTLWYGVPLRNNGRLLTSADEVLDDVNSIGLPADPTLTRDGHVGALFECYKYVPGLKHLLECRELFDLANCHIETVPLVARDDAPTCSPDRAVVCHSEDMARSTTRYIAPCCRDWDGDNPPSDRPDLITPDNQVCTRQDALDANEPSDPPPGPVPWVSSLTFGPGASAAEQPAICNLRVEFCDKAVIEALRPHCLRRQIIPIVTNNWPPELLPTSEPIPTGLRPRVFVHNRDLLAECTPCRDQAGRAPADPGFDISTISELGAECGQPVSFPDITP